ncbi:MAG: hypothetical protein GY716_15665 [bacterium]|nr:hypothetical protein [bacterium]
MTLKPILNSQEELDGLSETLKTEYVRDKADDGTPFWRLDVEPTSTGWELANTGGLKSALNAEKTSRKQFENELKVERKRLEGVDLDALQAGAARLAELEASGDKTAEQLAERERLLREQIGAQFETKETAMRSAHDEALAQLQEKYNGTSGQLDSTLVAVAASQAQQVVDPKASLPLLTPAIEGRTRVMEENGVRRVQVLDEAGNVKHVIRDGTAVEATVVDLMHELKGDPTYGRAFSGGEASGSDARPGEAGRDVKDNPFDRDSQAHSVTDAMKLAKDNPNAAQDLASRVAMGPRRSPIFSKGGVIQPPQNAQPRGLGSGS